MNVICVNVIIQTYFTILKIWIVFSSNTLRTILIDNKTINKAEILNSDLLKKLKIINKNSTKLKILGTGMIKDKINIEANLASKTAVEKLEKVGGSIQLKK